MLRVLKNFDYNVRRFQKTLQKKYQNFFLKTFAYRNKTKIIKIFEKKYKKIYKMKLKTLIMKKSIFNQKKLKFYIEKIKNKNKFRF